ncbi:unnamed protein product, partial [Effrenium voratum]
RRAGQLSATAAQLSTASGTLRSVQDLKRDLGPMRPLARPGAGNQPVPRIAGPATAAASMLQDRRDPAEMMSLSPSQTMASWQKTDLESAMSPQSTVPGEVPAQMSMTSTEFQMFQSQSQSIQEEPHERGVWYPGYSMAGPPAGSSLLIVCFGDAKRGQLGVDHRVRFSKEVALVVEELRGQEPVQIEAAGVASFVVGSKGQVWAFGSNRSMELGGRKEVAQISSAQRMKSVRGVHVVQVSSANSTSGQCHTLVLGANGEVHTFGASNCGALGQGPDVRQSAPLLLRFSAQVPVKLVAAGARHSLMLTDTGRLFAMGDNTHGQLGLESRLHGSFIDAPRSVEGPLGDEEVQVKLIAAGDNFTMAVTEDQMVPQLVPQLSNLAGLGRTAMEHRKPVWAWGSNVHGQLGVGTDNSNALSNRRGMVACQVTAASNHSLLYENGVEKLWLPVRVVSLSQYRVRAVTTGDMHTLTIAQHYHS